jgi:hypothetical protein
VKCSRIPENVRWPWRHCQSAKSNCRTSPSSCCWLSLSVNDGGVQAANTTDKIDDVTVQGIHVAAQIHLDESDSVLVSPRQTLYRISVNSVGRYDPELFAEIRSLNPWLRDPNHLPAGQRLVIPSTVNLRAERKKLANQGTSHPPQEVSNQ